ncbi:MAG: polysaccharide biosynthesis tyrosine autokinase [Elusimicrobia bacterium]|nr:polysaccharide biosynthesis tyrosine autokinase [Elusimicrobiota bacterium]
MIDAPTAQPELSLPEYWSIFMRRRWIFALLFVPCVGTALLYAFLSPPVYEGKTLVELEKPRETGQAERLGPIIGTIDEEYYETEYRRFKSDTLDQKVYDKLQLDKIPEFAPPQGLQKLQNAIVIAPMPRTRFAHVKVRSRDPKLAAQISNSLATAFVQEHVSNALFMSRDVLQSLKSGRRGRDRKELFESLPAVVDNKLIQSAKEAKITLEGQIADMSGRLTPQHPQLIAAHKRLNALNANLDREVQNIVNSMKTQLSGKFLGNNARIIDPAAVPDLPIKPKRSFIAIVGFIAGALAGLFAVGFVDSMDESIRTKEDVEMLVREPFLGVIPFALRKRGARIYDALLQPAALPASEAFRNLRIMVDLADGEQRPSALLVTGAVKDEGKSFVAANLAVAFAQSGERVLLIEGDLRRPVVHTEFATAAGRGISDFLADLDGSETTASLVQSTEIPNLAILPCGSIAPNPSELLSTPRLGVLVAAAVRAFDRVIVDCPPMFPINDTLLWGRHIRAALLVTRFGSTPSPLAAAARERLRMGGIKTLGVVVNGARLSSLTYMSGYYDQHYQAYAAAALPAPSA